MNKSILALCVSFVLSLGLWACGSDDWYGEEPVIGDVPTTTIEQAFPNEIFMLTAETNNEANVVAAYAPGFGQICLAYGVADTGVVGGAPNLTEVPFYSAQVFQAYLEGEDYFFYGKMFQWVVAEETWQLFGSYEYHPNADTPFLLVSPENLNEVKMFRSDYEVSEYLSLLNDCRPLEGDPTSAP